MIIERHRDTTMRGRRATRRRSRGGPASSSSSSGGEFVDRDDDDDDANEERLYTSMRTHKDDKRLFMTPPSSRWCPPRRDRGAGEPF
mmetsp:Transcript_10691/g.43248  ORF Transcript_10691/g.43248 Transcript_10691/m.43248 type:complete len:87 (+) Transcript_10691:783-1043(+)